MNSKTTLLFHLSVHFRGQVENGESLESSYGKGSSFRFKLGQGKQAPSLLHELGQVC